MGFWISLPLAAVSLTGIYLAFPQTMRPMMESMAPLSPRPACGLLGGQIARDPAMTADAALATALKARPGTKPTALFLAVVEGERRPRGEPAGQRGPGTATSGTAASGTAASGTATWRIQVRDGSSGDTTTLLVDDKNGAVRSAPAPLAGDHAVQWIRWLHEG